MIALAANGLLWKGAVEASPWWFLLLSGGLVPREGELRLLRALPEAELLESSSAGTADPDRVPVRLAEDEVCAVMGAGEEALEAGRRERLVKGTVRWVSDCGLTELRPLEASRLMAGEGTSVLELLDEAAWATVVAWMPAPTVA